MRILIFTVLILALVSCEKELNITLSTASLKTVINANIFQDKVINANIYRTSLITENHTNLWYIDTAIVKVYADAIFIEQLKLESLGKYTGTHLVKPNTNYRIVVEVNNLKTAVAKTKTRYKVPILELDSLGLYIDPETQNTMYKFGIRFNDNGEEENYYMVDFSENNIGKEVTDIYSTDPSIEVGKEGYTYPDGNTLYGNFYFDDELFNGSEYRFTFVVPQDKVFNGFTVNFSHITPEYFKYAQTYSVQTSDDGFEMFFQAVQVYSNVENGLGIFGALSSYSKSYQYEPINHGGNNILN